MTDDPHPLSEDDATAAEHALGVLTAQERARAEARMATDPAFAAQVVAWRERLAPLAAEAPSIAPSPEVWAAVARGLPANDDAPLARRLKLWRGIGAASMTLAAASLAAAVILAVRPIPTPAPTPAPPLLNASLSGGAQPLFVVAYDPARRALVVTSLVPPGADPAHVHQLWLIPGDGRPRSLGFVEPGRSKAIAMSTPMADLVAAGSALAVSVEPPGGSTRADGPSGPIAAQGKLAEI